MEQQPLYTITGIAPEYVAGSDGRQVHGYRVTFRTATGHTSYVLVPRSETQAEDMHAAVKAEAQQLVDAVNHAVTEQYTPLIG